MMLDDDGREERGRAIAERSRIRRKGHEWIVPSASHAGTYRVDLSNEPPTCSCPDFETRGVRCKHIHAVEFTIIRQTAPDGTVTETRSVRVTYKQNWPAYNAAQTHERDRVETLLRALCDGIPQPVQAGRGRPRARLSDTVFAATMKVYGTMSGRRTASDLRDCAARGLVASAPHYNTVAKYLEDPALTPILKGLIEESARPLKGVETDFAVDSSGFSTCAYVRWFDEKYGREMRQHGWRKVHLMCGVRTNIVTAVEVTDGNANDSPRLPALVNSTAERFRLGEVSADKGYLSRSNVDAVVMAGGTPFIPFKQGTGTGGKADYLWNNLYHYYQFRRADFLSHYHKRSNVESTFWMVKSKFGERLRSKSPVAQCNEVLAKVLCHNLCCLVSSIYELGIAPTFWTEQRAA